MRPQFFLGLGCSVLLLLAACGGAPASTQLPTAVAAQPTSRATSEPAATVAPSQAVGATCAGAPASLTPDPDLASQFPAQIDGNPVTVTDTHYWWESMCAYAGQAGIDAWKAAIPERFHLILTDVSYASAVVTVDGDEVEFNAFRSPGLPGFLTVLYPELVQMVRHEMPSGTGQSTSYATIGGKEVTIQTLDGTAAYLYATQEEDVVFALTDVTESQAERILAALP